jgi:hypothetical protein
MEKRFGDAYKEVSREDKMTGSKFMNTFEVSKRKFSDMEEEMLVTLPLWMNKDKIPASVSSNEQYHWRDGEVILTQQVVLPS